MNLQQTAWTLLHPQHGAITLLASDGWVVVESPLLGHGTPPSAKAARTLHAIPAPKARATSAPATTAKKIGRRPNFPFLTMAIGEVYDVTRGQVRKAKACAKRITAKYGNTYDVEQKGTRWHFTRTA